jgi:hypothetical protein
MDPFFIEIKKYPILEKSCRIDLVKLPESHTGKRKIKAILLGADPTNDGIKTNRGLKQLDTVFGIDSEYEKYFFKLQADNLNAINLTKDNLYIQNVCRNYFSEQTNDNKSWEEVAGIWKNYLIDELNSFHEHLPILATCKEVFMFLTGIEGPYTKIYSMETSLSFFSSDFRRFVFPLFRGRAYMFYKENWLEYRYYLNDYFRNI